VTDRPTIDIDLDGVVYPVFSEVVSDFIFHDSFKRYPRQATTWNFPTVDWNMSDAEFNGWVQKGLAAEYIFREGFPIDGSVEGMGRLDEAGYRIRIVTQRLGWPMFHAQIIANTSAWLEEWKIPYHSIWFQGKGDKKNTDGLWLLDDRPDNVREHRNGVLFGQAHNWGAFEIMERDERYQVVRGWDEFVELVAP